MEVDITYIHIFTHIKCSVFSLIAMNFFFIIGHGLIVIDPKRHEF